MALQSPKNHFVTEWLPSDIRNETYFKIEIWETPGGNYAHRTFRGFGHSDRRDFHPASWSRGKPSYRDRPDIRMKWIKYTLNSRGYEVGDLGGEIRSFLNQEDN